MMLTPEDLIGKELNLIFRKSGVLEIVDTANNDKIVKAYAHVEALEILLGYELGTKVHLKRI